MKFSYRLLSIFLPFLCIPLLGSRNIGSAKMLKGKTYSVMFFVSDANSSWSKEDKQKLLLQIIDAETWLTAEALKYNNTLKFEHGFFGWEQDIKLESLPEGTASGKEEVRLVEKIIQKVGYSTPQELIDQIKTDNIQLLFIFKTNGISYALPYAEEVDIMFYLESMAIYQQFDDKTPQCTACIAHEMLHLFGAWDLYKTHQTTQVQEDKARALYPNSIMLRTSYNISELNIDPVTAWRVGWIAEPPKGAIFFTPHPK